MLTNLSKSDRISKCFVSRVTAQIAQLVEQRTENPRVTGSIPVLGTWFSIQISGCSSMVEHQPSKLDTWVRFPSPALTCESMLIEYARVAQLVEHDLAKVGAAGSSPVSRSRKTV